MSERLVEVAADAFADLVAAADRPVLVDFWAPWCGPCKAMAPVIERLAVDYDGRVLVAKCNVDDHPSIPAGLGIQSIPTLLLFKHGRPVGRIIGLAPAARIQAFLDEALAGTRPAPSLATI